jgi:N-acetylglucosamine repressor
MPGAAANSLRILRQPVRLTGPRRPAQLDLLKDLNRASILAIVRDNRPVSRPEIARRSGLSKGTATVIVDELLQAGLVREIGAGESTGGRRPQLVEFVPSARLAVGAEFAHGTVAVVVTDFDGRALRQTERSVPLSTPDEVLARTSEAVADVLRDVDVTRVLGLGFASPGLVDMERGVVTQAVDLSWRDVPAGQYLSEHLGLPVAVANRSKTAALAESWVATPPRPRHLVYVFVGSGLAAGLVHDDALFVGGSSSAGELGHVTVDPDGPVCECGNTGCLHVLAGEEAIVRRARELTRRVETSERSGTVLSGDPHLITADRVIDAAIGGDELALGVIRDAGIAIGVALANVVNLLNPDEIIIGGPTSRVGMPLLEPIQQEIRRRALHTPASHVTVRLSTLGRWAGAIGGAILVLGNASRTLLGAREAPTRLVSGL